MSFHSILLSALLAAPLTTPVSAAEPAPPAQSQAQTSPNAAHYKVVFEVTVDGPEKWQAALRNVENARKALGPENMTIEVITHGKGIGLLLAKNADADAELKAKVEKLHADGVIFDACQNTMRRENIAPADLIKAAVPVDSGVGQLIRKQAEGYLYVKTGG